MPELPDLEYIVRNLKPRVTGRTITEVTVLEPIVIRMLLPNAGGFADALPGRTIEGLQRHGPFLHFRLSGAADLIIHAMLAGRLQISAASVKAVPHLCFALALDSGELLRYGDET